MRLISIASVVVAGALLAGCAQFAGGKLAPPDRLTLACESYARALSRAAEYEFVVGFDPVLRDEIDARVEVAGPLCRGDVAGVPDSVAAQRVASAADFIAAALPADSIGRLQ